MSDHTLLPLQHDDNALPTGRGFRAVCSCGWVSVWRTTNACAGNWRRHRAAMRRRAQKQG